MRTLAGAVVATAVLCLACGGGEPPRKRKPPKRAPADLEWIGAGIVKDGGCSACTESVKSLGGTVHASSELKEGAVVHSVERVLDRDVDKAWCEGVDGTGAGSWVEFRFPRPVVLGELHVVGGYAKSAGTLTGNGRAKVLRIELDGKKAGRVGLLDVAVPHDPDTSMREWLPLLRKLPAIAYGDDMGLKEGAGAKRVRFVLESVYPGARHADTCISLLEPSFVDPDLE